MGTNIGSMSLAVQRPEKSKRILPPVESLVFLCKRYWDNRRKSNDKSVISLEASSVSIAVHIRRGGLFVYNRTLIPDSVYASLMCDVKTVLDRTVGVSVSTTVHMYIREVFRWATWHITMIFLNLKCTPST